MCGGYGYFGPNMKQRFRVDRINFSMQEKYSVRPSGYAPVIYQSDDKTIAVKAKFGLIPSWAKDPKIGYKTFNARSETVWEKPAFREPFYHKRCIVPADYFIEWQKIDNKSQPYAFRMRTKEPFGMAGLYDIWKDAEGYPLYSFCILTTAPNALVGAIHDRMPVLLSKEKEQLWISQASEIGQIKQLLLPYPDGLMEKEQMPASPKLKRGEPTS